MNPSKGFISSVMTYTHPTHVFEADTHLLKLLHLQNKAVHSIGSFHCAHQLSAVLAVSMVHTNCPQYWQCPWCTPTVCSTGSVHRAHQLSALLAVSMVHTNCPHYWQCPWCTPNVRSTGSVHGAHQLSAVLAVSMVHTNCPQYWQCSWCTPTVCSIGRFHGAHNPCDIILLQNDVPGIQMKCEIGKGNTYSLRS